MMRSIVNDLRFAAARLRKGTVRYYCGNLPAFYAALRDEGIAPLVLRWTDDVPMTASAEASNTHDVDHLIADGTARRIGRIAARFPGPVKCDFYSVSGQSGSTYKGMPYYAPALALRMLGQAVDDPRGFLVSPPDAEFVSFAYHLCYHKGHRAGIALGLNGPAASQNPSRNYAVELARLAKLAGYSLPDPLTIAGLDALLRNLGWGMPHDLMTRWPDQHPFLRSLTQELEATFEKEKDAAKGLTVFLIRADCGGASMRAFIVDRVSSRFDIREHLVLDEAQKARLMVQTRGGNWIEKYAHGIVAPVEALICRDAATRGPMPSGMSAQTVAKRYPHVENTDVLIKREIRKQVNAKLGKHSDRVVLHATDNAAEAASTLNAIYGSDSWIEVFT